MKTKYKRMLKAFLGYCLVGLVAAAICWWFSDSFPLSFIVCIALVAAGIKESVMIRNEENRKA